ncbi:endolytic transglycosylase MltG [Thermomonas carbonis]|uniref:Endolytic murein transglycosylase n=1 Tax=Thermomonas carbonis TaxID=1463158 RepID=A0A7G9SMU3_9GAMM|nr:endolytic transglycosylase MltG [Thermomonas carbonis]QNN69168.1 endolytic transglycosylase MltG [Thermomonas carbonis]GHC06326.1 aminodeoxychorismate lyase [Thermomonas carbonis]
MSRGRTGGFFRRAFLVLLLAAVAVGAWYWTRYQGFADAPLVGIGAGDSLVVKRGDSLDKVLRTLQAQGVDTGDRLQWQVLARQTGAAGKLQVGEYALVPDTSPRALLLAMRDGKVVRRNFTIVEGWNIRDVRAALAKVDGLEHDSAGLDDAALMKALGHPGQHPEGRFLPETYAWVQGDSDLDLLKRAHKALQVALDEAWATRAEDLPLKNADEALVLASIVEKETGIAEERPAIAGVFVRRLKIGMRLQTDPTVIYGMGAAYAGNIRRSDLTTDTPYNTYTRAGLTPTPIAMPGKAALRAATRPADADALYFVAVGDGSGRHVFSPSLDAHNAAVREYLRRYRAQREAAPK